MTKQKHRAKRNSQLQQSAVSVAIACLLLALLGQVILERGNSLGVVTLETVDDGGDVLGALCRVFAVHLGLRFGDVVNNRIMMVGQRRDEKDFV